MPAEIAPLHLLAFQRQHRDKIQGEPCRPFFAGMLCFPSTNRTVAAHFALVVLFFVGTKDNKHGRKHSAWRSLRTTQPYTLTPHRYRNRLAFSSRSGNDIDKMFPRKMKGIGTMYFGIVDIWVFIGYAFCLFSALLCVVYGLINWNKNGVDITPEDVAWAEEEDAITKEL